MKRADIQGLRTVAILAVIFFHIWPTYFPSGFLGVDIFFAISGHLITKCLINIGTNVQFSNEILNFYKNRIKRIVPIYLLIIFTTASFVRILMNETDFKRTTETYYWTLGFAMNIKVAFFNPTPDSLFTYSPYLHAWSLGAEMQFYILAPLLVFVINIFENSSILSSIITRKKIKLFALYFILLSLSFYTQQISSMRTVGYGFLFCRLWQFIVGIISYLIRKIDDSNNNENEGELNERELLLNSQYDDVDETNDNNINCKEKMTHEYSSKSLSEISFRLMHQQYFSINIWKSYFVLFNYTFIWAARSGPSTFGGGNWPLIKPYQSISVVILTFIILYGKQYEDNLILTNKLMVWLGDISYVIYLVHYPIITFIKYFFKINEFSFKMGIAIILPTFVISCVFDFIDKKIRKIQNFKLLILIIGILYALCLFQARSLNYEGLVNQIQSIINKQGGFIMEAIRI
uniref:Acyltransferase 3 domain-containing protein n=1 Tax=Meloidogyne enterolobii TaxID=390850 RepID=A0A6V7U358_MELEN|nr:unnamed protein product [Meloidogyne enterolobii]